MKKFAFILIILFFASTVSAETIELESGKAVGNEVVMTIEEITNENPFVIEEKFYIGGKEIAKRRWETNLDEYLEGSTSARALAYEEGEIPEEDSLMQNYPNPFNPSTTIRFSTPAASYVTLEVLNARGEKVAVLVSEELSAGTYNYEWKAKDLTSGIYFYRLSTESFSESKKMILLK